VLFDQLMMIGYSALLPQIEKVCLEHRMVSLLKLESMFAPAHGTHRAKRRTQRRPPQRHRDDGRAT